MASRHPFLLYHWSPASRRYSILKRGLVPGKKPTTGPVDGWRAPYICFCAHPNYAWSMSATHASRTSSWDLWLCWSDQVKAKKRRVDQGWCGHPKEYRVYGRIPKRHLWMVGTRTFKKRAKR